MKIPVKKLFAILLIFSVFLIACNNSSKTEPKNPKNPDTLSVNATTDNNSGVKLVTVFKGIDAQSIPQSVIMLSVDGKQSLVKNITGEAAEIPKSEYEKYQIPSNAVSACGAYFAGGGDYFYVALNKGNPEVYAGWQDEPHPDNKDWTPGYHWEKMKPK